MKIVILCISFILAIVPASYSQVKAEASPISKETSLFNKRMQRPATDYIRVSSINIDIVNERVVVVYQLGNIVDSEFHVEDQRTITFTSEDGKQDFNDVLAEMKVNLPALISILMDKVNE